MTTAVLRHLQDTAPLFPTLSRRSYSAVTSITPRRTPTDSGWYSTTLAQPLSLFHFLSISNTYPTLPHSLIHHLPLLLPDPHSLAAASTAELHPSINM